PFRPFSQGITPSQFRSKKAICPMPLEHEIAEGLRFDRFASDYDSRLSQCPVRTTVRNRLVDIVRAESARPVGGSPQIPWRKAETTKRRELSLSAFRVNQRVR